MQKILSLGPKHQVRDKFKKILFWLMWIFLSQLKSQNVTGELSCEDGAAAKVYVKRIETVDFDRGVGFCIMKKDQYEDTLLDYLQFYQFKAMVNTDHSVALKFEKDINKELLRLKKSNDISEHL